MSDSQQAELYQQMILAHNKNPRHFGKLDHPTHHAEGYNPLCGDHYHVYITVDGKGVISDMAFQGDGCAISKASASMMTDLLIGKDVGEAEKLFHEFQDLAMHKLEPEKDEHHLGKLTVFSGIWQYPSRIKCAVLSWHAMKGALENKKEISTENEEV